MIPHRQRFLRDPRSARAADARDGARHLESELLSQDGWDIDARLFKGRDEFGTAVVSAAGMVYTPAA
jgi:hypothetical protein